MLKTTRSSDKPAPNKNYYSKSAFSRNDNSRPAFGKNDSNNEVDRVGGNGVKHAKKSGKSKKLSKLGKRPLKSGNSPKSSAKKSRPTCLTSGAKTDFNCLRLAFTKALILWHFDPEYHI